MQFLLPRNFVIDVEDLREVLLKCQTLQGSSLIESSRNILLKMDFLKCSPETWIENEAAGIEYFSDNNNWSKIPTLNNCASHDIADNTLVRFRGMIQDMHNLEFYFEKYEVLNNEKNVLRVQNGKFRDTLKLESSETINHESATNGERQTMFVISIPGLNTWACEVEKEKSNLPNSSTRQPNQTLKRSLPSDNDMDVDSAPDNNIPNTSEAKKITVDSPAISTNENSSSLLSPEYILNSPLSDRPSKATLVKIYDDFDNYKLNDLIEVLGFISVDPAMSILEEDEMDSEGQAHNPSPSLVPRIHAVQIKKLSHFNPLVDDTTSLVTLKNQGWANQVRRDLHLIFTEALFGDELAADYLICHLISAIYIRRDDITLGQFCLNLSNMPDPVKNNTASNYTKHLYRILEELLTASHYLPMTIDNLNSLAFLPKKDYETNRLVSGVLQLCKGTHLILDEVQLSPGQLNASGISNLETLKSLIKTQQLSYDFKYYRMDFESDIPVLVLSEGKSLLQMDVHVPVVFDPIKLTTIKDVLPAIHHFLTPELTKQIRTYLTLMKQSQFNVDDDMQEFVRNDYVTNMSRTEGAGPDDLHLHLGFARLVGISRGEMQLNEDLWKITRDLEKHRKERLVNNRAQK